MKYWLSHLPLEVWADVFESPEITRKKMAQIANNIGNRGFTEKLQKLLHGCGKQSLGTLQLDKATLPNIPLAPLPENIKFFKQLTICHFDFHTLLILHRISTLFNANDVNLDFHYCEWAIVSRDLTRTILHHLAPLLHGIHSLYFNQDAIPLVEQHFAQKLAQVKQLTLHLNFNPATDQAFIDFCLNWLTSGERDPAEPRFLKVYTICMYIIQQFSEAIQQQFLSTKSPCTFAIEFNCSWHDPDTLNEFQLENGIGEQLRRHQSNQFGTFQIFRHQPNAGTALQEWVKATARKSGKSSVIRIDATTEKYMELECSYCGQ